MKVPTDNHLGTLNSSFPMGEGDVSNQLLKRIDKFSILIIQSIATFRICQLNNAINIWRAKNTIQL